MVYRSDKPVQTRTEKNQKERERYNNIADLIMKIRDEMGISGRYHAPILKKCLEYVQFLQMDNNQLDIEISHYKNLLRKRSGEPSPVFPSSNPSPLFTDTGYRSMQPSPSFVQPSPHLQGPPSHQESPSFQNSPSLEPQILQQRVLPHPGQGLQTSPGLQAQVLQPSPIFHSPGVTQIESNLVLQGQGISPIFQKSPITQPTSVQTPPVQVQSTLQTPQQQGALQGFSEFPVNKGTQCQEMQMVTNFQNQERQGQKRMMRPASNFPSPGYIYPYPGQLLCPVPSPGSAPGTVFSSRAPEHSPNFGQRSQPILPQHAVQRVPSFLHNQAQVLYPGFFPPPGAQAVTVPHAIATRGNPPALVPQAMLSPGNHQVISPQAAVLQGNSSAIIPMTAAFQGTSQLQLSPAPMFRSTVPQPTVFPEMSQVIPRQAVVAQHAALQAKRPHTLNHQSQEHLFPVPKHTLPHGKGSQAQQLSAPIPPMQSYSESPVQMENQHKAPKILDNSLLSTSESAAVEKQGKNKKQIPSQQDNHPTPLFQFTPGVYPSIQEDIEGTTSKPRPRAASFAEKYHPYQMTKPLIQQESLSQSQKGAQSPVERTPPPVFAPEGSVVEHKSLMNHDTIEATQHLLDPDLSTTSDMISSALFPEDDPCMDSGFFDSSDADYKWLHSSMIE